jgi:hypothetical protein
LLDAEADDWYMHVRDERMRQPDYITVPMSAGDGLLFSAFLLHRSGTNRSEDIRCSLQFRFNDLAEPSYVSRGFPDPYTYSPGRDLITPDFPTHEDLATTFGP